MMEEEGQALNMVHYNIQMAMSGAQRKVLESGRECKRDVPRDGNWSPGHY